jgi:hypothetical protein
MGVHQIVDAIDRLAQSVGAARMTNPEAPLFYHEPPNIEALLDRIEAATGLRLLFPNPFPDEFGITTSRGIASLRAVFAIYQAHRLQQEIRASAQCDVLEIGAGLGRTAYYAAKSKISAYTIIDLPLANAAQAYFLGRTIGQDRISLAGEKARPGQVTILPPSSLTTLTQVGVMLNVDSLTEMDRSSAEAYVHFAKENAERFISINHEANRFTANEVIRALWPAAKIMRYPHPMRDGYVEEIAFNPARTLAARVI